MTPEERNLVIELFDRLAALEDAPRDPDAERLIRDGLRQAPNAIYALVQTAIVQDEALKRADVRIRELEAQAGNGAEAPRSGGFLDNMRDNFMGRRDTPRAGSVPSVRPAGATGAPAMGEAGGYAAGGYAAGAQPMGPGPGTPAGPGGSGGSFLGTAAAAAAGSIGGSLLLSGIRSMMGGSPHGFGGTPASAAGLGGSGGTPWGGSGGSGSGGSLARDAGLDDIGKTSGTPGDDGSSRGRGLFGNNDDKTESADDQDLAAESDDDDDGGDFDDDDGGDDGDGGGEE
jgi:hypothetical protein